MFFILENCHRNNKLT